MRKLLLPATLVSAVSLLPLAAGHRPTLYSAQSPFNTPIAAHPALDPNSRRYVAKIVQVVNQKGFPFSRRLWSTPVWYATARTAKTRVRLTASWRGADFLDGVPIPADAKPDPSDDGHLVVLDQTHGCEYDFWQARRNPDGSWQASWGNALSSRGDGRIEGGASANASGFGLAAGLIFPAEMKAGVIRHALNFASPFTRAGGPVWPATNSDGRSTDPAALPEGARLQLDPALDLSQFHLARWQLVIAHALQHYGMYLTDTGGAVGVSGADEIGFTQEPWTALGVPGDDFPKLPSALAQHLRVLKLPAQFQNKHFYVDSGCGRLR